MAEPITNAQPNWKPIETLEVSTAVRIPVLLYLSGDGWHGKRQCDVVVGIWTGSRWYAISDGCGGVVSSEPSHWMPLPAPPEAQS